MQYPFVREDSHWKAPGEQPTVDPIAKTSASLEDLLTPRDPLFYIPCLDSDRDQEGCFQMGNLRVRIPKSTTAVSRTSSDASHNMEPDATSTS